MANSVIIKSDQFWLKKQYRTMDNVINNLYDMDKFLSKELFSKNGSLMKILGNEYITVIPQKVWGQPENVQIQIENLQHIREKLLIHIENEIKEWELYREPGEENCTLTQYPEDNYLVEINKCLCWYHKMKFQEFLEYKKFLEHCIETRPTIRQVVRIILQVLIQEVNQATIEDYEYYTDKLNDIQTLILA